MATARKTPAPRKSAKSTTPAVDDGALRDRMLAQVFDTLAAQPTHAARARMLGVPEAQHKSFRGALRGVGSFIGGSRGADAAVVTPDTLRAAYNASKTIRTRVDAFVDAALAAPVE